VVAIDRQPSRLLRLGTLALVTLGLSTQAGATDRAHGSVMIYSDNDHVTVIAPAVTGSRDIGHTTVDAQVRFDLISAASVDLMTAASPRGFTETRTQVDAGARQDFGLGTALDLGYHLSHEPDFLTHGAHIGGTRDILGRQATVTGSYGFGWSDVGRHGDPTFSKSRQTHDADLGWTQILSPNAALDMGYGLGFVQGFQASAYRFVRLYAPGADVHATSVAERTPDQRFRHALHVRLRTRPVAGLFVHGDYRFYTDSWGMTGHTLTLRGAVELTPAWTLTAEGRGHVQDAVTFYRARYDTIPEAPDLRTADKELGPMWTALAGLHLAWQPDLRAIEGLRVSAGTDVLHMRYLDYAFLSARTAWIVTFDVTWEP
jgi:hypothetical protein